MRFVILLACLLMACEPTAQGPTPPTSDSPARPDDATIRARVVDVRTKLSPDRAGQPVLAAMAMHGGLNRWYANGPLGLRYFYGEKTRQLPIDTQMMVDTWASRAVHTFSISQDSIKGFFGWNGEEAWLFPPGIAPPVNARYWSLTPYYFLALPFVMGDPGVVLELEEEAELNGRLCHVIRMTFEPGTGASPDDYYVVYIDKETNRVAGYRFIVSYPGFFPNGGYFPERMAIPHSYSEVDGILFPDSLLFYDWVDGEMGERQAAAYVTGIQFNAEAENGVFWAPDDAEILPGF